MPRMNRCLHILQTFERSPRNRQPRQNHGTAAQTRRHSRKCLVLPSLCGYVWQPGATVRVACIRRRSHRGKGLELNYGRCQGCCRGPDLCTSHTNRVPQYNHDRGRNHVRRRDLHRHLPTTSVDRSHRPGRSPHRSKPPGRVRIVRESPGHDPRRGQSLDSMKDAMRAPTFHQIGKRGGTAALRNILAPLGAVSPQTSEATISFGVGVSPPPVPGRSGPLTSLGSGSPARTASTGASTPKSLPKLDRAVVANAIKRQQQFAQTAYMSHAARTQHLLATASGSPGASTGAAALPTVELSISERLQRMYSEISDTAHYTPSDRIGRNYSATAIGLTMRNVRARSRIETQRGVRRRPRMGASAARLKANAPPSQLTQFPVAQTSLATSARASPGGFFGRQQSPTTHLQTGGFGELVDERNIDLSLVRWSVVCVCAVRCAPKLTCCVAGWATTPHQQCRREPCGQQVLASGRRACTNTHCRTAAQRVAHEYSAAAAFAEARAAAASGNRAAR